MRNSAQSESPGSYADLGIDLSSVRLSQDTQHLVDVFSHEPMSLSFVKELCRILDADPRNRELWKDVLDCAELEDSQKKGSAESVDGMMLGSLLGDPPTNNLDEWRQRAQDRIRHVCFLLAPGSLSPVFLEIKNQNPTELLNLAKAFRSLYVAVRIKNFCHDVTSCRSDTLRHRQHIPAGQSIPVALRAAVPEFATVSVESLVRFFRGQLSIADLADIQPSVPVVGGRISSPTLPTVSTPTCAVSTTDPAAANEIVTEEDIARRRGGPC